MTPESTFEWFDTLKYQTTEKLYLMGLRPYNKINNKKQLWLFPKEWFDYIPENYEVTDIFNDKEKFNKRKFSKDSKNGVLSYGITLNVLSISEALCLGRIILSAKEQLGIITKVQFPKYKNQYNLINIEDIEFDIKWLNGKESNLTYEMFSIGNILTPMYNKVINFNNCIIKQLKELDKTKLEYISINDLEEHNE